VFLLGDFRRDLARFRRHDQLQTAIRHLTCRSDTGFAALLIFGAVWLCFWMEDPVIWALLPLFIFCIFESAFVFFLVRVLTPIYFGSIARVRLRAIEFWAAGVYSTAELVLLDSERTVTSRIDYFRPLKATPGRAYVALRHPENNHIVLLILDDDTDLASYLLGFADASRRLELQQEISVLRRQD
jgi:hypothetical protein